MRPCTTAGITSLVVTTRLTRCGVHGYTVYDGYRSPPTSCASSSGHRSIRVTRDTLLTVRMNNMLMLVLGLPTLTLVVVAFAGSAWTGRGALIALSVLGGFF